MSQILRILWHRQLHFVFKITTGRNTFAVGLLHNKQTMEHRELTLEGKFLSRLELFRRNMSWSVRSSRKQNTTVAVFHYQRNLCQKSHEDNKWSCHSGIKFSILLEKSTHWYDKHRKQNGAFISKHHHLSGDSTKLSIRKPKWQNTSISSTWKRETRESMEWSCEKGQHSVCLHRQGYSRLWKRFKSWEISERKSSIEYEYHWKCNENIF